MPKDMVIRFEVEPIVNVKCVNGACVNNLAWKGFAACNLKHICIGSDGQCTDFVAKNAKPQGEDKAE